jgi:MFS family permease
MRWCAIIFMAAAVFGIADIAMFQFVHDPGRPPKTGSGLLRAMGTPLKDRQFVVFGAFVATLTFAVSFMGQFATLYLAERVYVGTRASSFGTGAQLMLVVMPMAAQLLVLPAWGAAADRMGKKPILAIAALGMVPIGIGWCFLSPSNIWLGYVLSFAGAVLWTGVEVANFNLVIEMSGRGGEQGGSAYVAVNTVVVNVAGCLGGLSAGVIAQVFRDANWTPGWGFKTFTYYDVLFLMSGLLRLAAVAVFLPFLHEPTAGRTGEALRFVTAGIYNNLFNAVLQPVRLLRGAQPAAAPQAGEGAFISRRAA